MNRRGSGPITEENTIKEEDEEKKNEKICREQTIKQTDSSKTETTLILCGSSGERANNRGEYYKRGG